MSVRQNTPLSLGEAAKLMARELLEKEFQGRGDTIEDAADRIETKHGVSASIVLQGRRRPAREMMVSRWMALFLAHFAEFSDKYEEMRNEADGCHPAILRLADLVAGNMATRPRKAEVRSTSPLRYHR